MKEFLRSYFTGDQVILHASSPGRMDVMGGIADYSGSLVLEMPIKEVTTAYVQANKTQLVQIRSLDKKGRYLDFTISLNLLKKKNFIEIQKAILKEPQGSWAVYVAGCLGFLLLEKQISCQGMQILITSEVPLGKGVSSSAALEVATMIALCQLFDIETEGTEIAKWAQKVENLIVGAPCGLMDQLTSYHGEKNRLLPILCQPDILYPSVKIPKGVHFSGIDSGIKHAVSGASYGDVRVAAFMGYSIIAKEEGASEKDLKRALEGGFKDHLPYGGYLANISPSILEEKYAKLLPRDITGLEFKKKYKLSIDPITQIQEDKHYDVYHCTQHPILENHRVQIFKSLLVGLEHTKDKHEKHRILVQLGELMFQSHASYSACKLGNAHTNEIVDMVRELIIDHQVYGAKITGGGSGGTVVVLSHAEGYEAVKNLFKVYEQKHGLNLHFFKGSTHGGKNRNA